MAQNDWEAIIGLEIHLQLNTRTKLFSGAPNRFGDEPNQNLSELCTGQPGALPILNREAVSKAVLLGCALDSSISPISSFDRKSYFYPDSPRGFQITQFYHPILKGGSLVCQVGDEIKTFQIHHAHLEDDAGMLRHFTQFAGVDFNRAGVPLIEVVSEPCMRSAEEASAYASSLKTLLEYLDICEGNMEEGHLRMDVNVSVRKKGENGLRPKVEIKNMNSFHNMELAIRSEQARQIALYESGGGVVGGTYRFDLEKGETVLMRAKESADDYRYFPEPDLPPIVLRKEEIEAIRSKLPELPHAKLKRYNISLGLPFASAQQLCETKELAHYFEEGLKTTRHGAQLANWMLAEFAGRLAKNGTDLLRSGPPARHIAELVNLIEAGTITGKIAKAVADEMVLAPATPPQAIIDANPDYKPLGDENALLAIIHQVLAQQPESVSDYRAGKQKAFEFLIGQVMKASRGKADPVLTRNLLREQLEK